MLFNNFEKYLKEKRGAIHVGAHEGQERTWYDKMGFDTVLWFEPNSEIYRKLCKNIQHYPTHFQFNVGIHDTLQEAELNISNNDGQSSSILQLKLHKLFHPKVNYIGVQKIKLVRLDAFLELVKFDIKNFNFLNIDVQGVELNVIKSLGDKIRFIDYIYTEVNEDELYEGCCLISDIDEYLKPYGFIRKETLMTKNKWGDAFYIKKELL